MNFVEKSMAHTKTLSTIKLQNLPFAKHAKTTAATAKSRNNNKNNKKGKTKNEIKSERKVFMTAGGSKKKSKKSFLFLKMKQEK